MTTTTVAQDLMVTDVARLAGRSARLRHRRFRLLAVRGPDAVFTGPQGRGPSSSSTAPAELVELISSIATVGVLQPVLVEETTNDAGTERLRLVAGERRLRAVTWGAAHQPDNPHFAALPAIVCPGPLTEEEVRIWQLVENLARDDLQPGELAAALLYERAALLAQRMTDAGHPATEDTWAIDDPVARWSALDTQRAAATPQVGAPWPDVLRRLGIQMRTETCKRLVRALRALPEGLSADMDAHDVALATRLSYLRLLNHGRSDAAAEIWAAVSANGRPQLLAAAVREATDDPVLGADAAVERAQLLHDAANEARRAANQPDTTATDHDPLRLEVTNLLAAQRAAIVGLRTGMRPSRYDLGSLRLGARQLLELLDTPATGDLHPDSGPVAGEVSTSEAAA